MSIASRLRVRWSEPQGFAEILRVGLPLVAGMASSTVMQFTDRWFLARYSVDAIAGALSASLVAMTIFLTLMGLCAYSTVLIAQYVGSGAPHRVGPALWQGVWCAFFSSVILVPMWWLAEPIFALAGHEAHIQVLEADYFRILIVGSILALVGASLGGFFSGRGQTRPVMVANIFAACLNIPLDYLFIFGGLGIPSMGIEGAALATALGWLSTVVILGALVFTRANDKLYHVIRGWRFEWDMFKRLLRFGLPSGVNLFMEMAGTTWFALNLGMFGTIALAASNIAFSFNSLIFLPTLGLNMAVSSLVGQAMGRGKPGQAERVTGNALYLAVAYMVPLALVVAVMAGPLMDLFIPGGMTPEDFAPVRSQGMIFLYFIAVYSLVDAGNIIFFGALKGAGDTFGVMVIMTGCLVALLVIPIAVLMHTGFASVYSLWIAFTVYIIVLALAAAFRFYRRGWHSIRVVETAPGRGQETSS